MAWNPSFSFKLRDDEVTFGTLIFDKSCADLLCEELLRIKQNGLVNINNIKAILDNGCFTDSELDNARNELELIKNDIVEFKQLLSVKQRFEAWYGNTATTGAYVIGSQSWYQYYSNLKMMAADMYFKLVSSGEQFEPDLKAGYESRYGEVLKQSSGKERTELALRRQFDENLANGVPNAREIYCEAMVAAGLMSEKQVEAQNKLFKAASSSEVDSVIKASKNGITLAKVFDTLWLAVESHNDLPTKAFAIRLFNRYVVDTVADSNIDIKLKNSNIEAALSGFFDDKTVTDAELYKSALWFKRYLKHGEHSVLFNETIIQQDIAWLDNMVADINGVSEEGSNLPNKDIAINTDTILKLYDEVFTIQDAVKKALIISELATSTIKILKDAGIVCSGLWEVAITEFLKGTGSVGTMVEVAESLRNVLSFEANKNIINTYNLNDSDINYTKLTRQIDEARVAEQDKLLKAYESSIVDSSIEETEKGIASIDLINNLWSAVKGHTSPRNKSLAIDKFHFYVKQILDTIGVKLSNDILEIALKDFFVKKDITADQLREEAIVYVNYLNTGRPSESIAGTSVGYSAGKIKAMLDDVKSTK